MSAPLLFVRDGRTLSFVPVTLDALSAIDSAVPPRRLAYARSLYMAILTMANEERGRSAAASRKTLGALAGCSPDLISDVAPLLVEAGVLEIVPRSHDGQRLENEWVIVEPSEVRAPMATSHDPHGHEPQLPVEERRSKEGVKPPPPKTSHQERIGIERVWETYVEWVLQPNHMRRELSEPARRLIKAALGVRTVDECIRAVIGLSRSEHHNGHNDRKKKYLDLRYALRGNSLTGQTIEERIDMMSDFAAPPEPKVSRYTGRKRAEDQL